MTFPVTAYQRRVLDELVAAVPGGAGPLNVMHRAYLAEGPLELDALARAGEMVLARHPALRVTFRQRAGEWRAHSDENPTVVVQTGWHGELPPTAGELARAVGARQQLFLPSDTPRFRVHVQREYPAHGQAVVVLMADPLVADERSMGLLAAAFSSAYNHQLGLYDPACALPDVVADRWRAHVESLAGDRAPWPASMPPWWRDLHQHVAQHGQADVDLPLATMPVSPGSAGGEAEIETVMVPADPDVDRLTLEVANAVRVDLYTVTLAAIAHSVAEAAGGDARLHLAVDTRTSDELGTIGSYTADTVLQIPRCGADVAAHLQVVQQLYAEATDPAAGLAWTELLQAAAYASPAAASRPTVAVAHPIPAPLRLAGVDVAELPRRPDVDGGRVVFQFANGRLRVCCEQGRFAEGLGRQLAVGVTEALRHFHTGTA